jgi:hypothetical protein
MAHAGTIDLGRQAKPSPSRNPWLVGFAVVAIAAVAVGYLATASGLTSGNLPAKAATVDRSYDQIEAQRGAVALPVVDRSYDQIETHRTLLTGLTTSGNGLSIHVHGRPVVPVAPVVTVPVKPGMTSGTFHTGLPPAAAPEMTSGTFHAGLPVPAERDRVGGP